VQQQQIGERVSAMEAQQQPSLIMSEHSRTSSRRPDRSRSHRRRRSHSRSRSRSKSHRRPTKSGQEAGADPGVKAHVSWPNSRVKRVTWSDLYCLR
jgi:hypothetical protein